MSVCVCVCACVCACVCVCVRACVCVCVCVCASYNNAVSAKLSHLNHIVTTVTAPSLLSPSLPPTLPPPSLPPPSSLPPTLPPSLLPSLPPSSLPPGTPVETSTLVAGPGVRETGLAGLRRRPGRTRSTPGHGRTTDATATAYSRTR